MVCGTYFGWSLGGLNLFGLLLLVGGNHLGNGEFCVFCAHVDAEVVCGGGFWAVCVVTTRRREVVAGAADEEVIWLKYSTEAGR